MNTSVWLDISGSAPSVIVDSTDYGFLLLTVFIPMALLQWVGVRGDKRLVARYGSLIIVGWLITSVVVAFGLARFTKYELQATGYQECANSFADDVGQRFGKRRVWALGAEHC